MEKLQLPGFGPSVQVRLNVDTFECRITEGLLAEKESEILVQASNVDSKIVCWP